MKPTITFDPGLKGGWAIQYSDGVIASGPMPDEGGIIDLVRGFKAGHANGCEAWVEDVPKFTGPMVPGAYVAVLFRNMGFILGALEGMGIRTILCTPQRWQKPLCLGTKAGAGGAAPWKRKLKCEAERRFPTVEVTLLNADALLILDYANANGLGNTNLAS